MIQNLLAMIDCWLTDLFDLGYSHMSSSDTSRPCVSTYFELPNGRRVGIVGTDGTIHTFTSWWAVRHYRKEGELVRRVAVRNDLKPGERRATPDELAHHLKHYRKGSSVSRVGMC